MYKTAFIPLLHGLSALFIFPFFSCPCVLVSAQSSMQNYARFSFSSLEWVFGSCMCHEFSLQSLSLFIQDSPFFCLFFFFFCVYTQECEPKNSLQGRGKGFSLSDLSLPFIAPFAQSFPAPPFPFSLSLSSLIFSPHALPSISISSLNLYWWFIGQLLQVH